MKYKIIIPAVLALACAKPEQHPVDREIAQVQEEVRRSQNEVEEQIAGPLSETKARQLAGRHLALRQLRWGEPISVREDEVSFYVSYQTPENELRLIGGRTLIVSKASGVVTTQKRR